MKSIRILHVLYTMGAGGIENWLLQVLRHIDRDRFQLDFLIHALDSHVCIDEIRSLGSNVILCSHPRKYFSQPWQYGRTFKQLLKECGGYHIVHSHTAHFNSYILYLAQQAGVPVRIAHSHNDSTLADARKTVYKRLYIAWAKSQIPRFATLGLAASRKAADYLFGANWQLDQRWQVLYCSLDLMPFKEQVDKAAVRAEFNIPADAFVIGHVGRLVEQKNHLFLIEIAAEVARKEPKMCLLLVGDGALKSQVKAKIKQVGLSDKVIFAGNRSDVPRLMLGAMDVFVFPSLYEGLGLVLIEAQAAGLPCILSDIIPEEADVLKSLMYRMKLSSSPSIWSEAVLAARSHKSVNDRKYALATVANSQFNVEIGAKKLAEVYESQIYQ